MNRLMPLRFAFLCSALAALGTLPGLSRARAAAPDDDAAIRKYRKGHLVVLAAPGATVTVQQTRHEFWFGSAVTGNAFDGHLSAADAARYKEVALENFNAIVPDVALKWHYTEPQPGHINYAPIDAMLDWADRHHLPVRGHNVFWGVKQFVQPWLQSLDDRALHQALEMHAHEISARFRGRFAEYDLNNEMIHENYYAERLGPGITKEMAQWMREGDPSCVLFLNDYDILTGKRLDDYVAHIRGLLAAGVPIGGIGVQGHLHGDTLDAGELRHALDVLAQFHLPIRVTEFNFPGQRSKFYEHPDMPMSAAEEEAKARALTEYYRICFAHPAVDGILMWGFWAGDNWIPQSSLYARDWTPTPAAKAYRQLVFGDWWTHWTGRADAEGRCDVPAFYGNYHVTAGDKTSDVVLAKREGMALVDLR